MSDAKSAFKDVREAISAVNSDRPMKLSDIRKIKSETLGWNSNVAQFRRNAEEQLKELPRGDEQKNVIRLQKKELSELVGELREALDSAQNLTRMQKAERKDQQIHKSVEALKNRVIRDISRLREIDGFDTDSFVTELINQNSETESQETVEAV